MAKTVTAPAKKAQPMPFQRFGIMSAAIAGSVYTVGYFFPTTIGAWWVGGGSLVPGTIAVRFWESRLTA